jgi:hypothetical protein
MSIHGTPAIVVPTFHSTIEELLERGEAISKLNRNAYFLPGSLHAATTRKAENVRSLRSFFLDVDCGERKPYPTQAEGLAALNKFVQDAGLPKPWIVNSGYGLHVYWPVDRDVPAEEWQPYATAFKAMVIATMEVDPERVAMLRSLDLASTPVDAAVSADRTRVLRMVNTVNAKPGREIVPVGLMQTGEISDFVSLTSKFPAPITEARRFGMDGFTKSNDEYPLTNFSRIVRRSLGGTGCAQIAHAVTGAATLSEPLWRAALSIAWRCEDAETSIHKISKAHPEYDFDATLAKASKTGGPMTCKWYRENNPSLCESCEHRITSPIQLGRKILEAPPPEPEPEPEPEPVPAEEPAIDAAARLLLKATPKTATIPPLPFPYFRGITGGVYMRGKDKGGESTEELIYPYDLYITNRYFDLDPQGEGDGEMVGLNLHTPLDGVRHFVVPVSTLLVKERMRDVLLKQGVIALSKELDGIMAYLAKFIKDLQRQVLADRTRSQLGWTADNQGFVVGEREYTATEIRLAPSSASVRMFAPLMVPTGSLSSWREVANFYDRPGMEMHALAWFFALGAPLVKLVGGMEVRGATVNLMSQHSGTGKTTAQFMANSMFGHPSALMLKKTDTGLSKWQYLGGLNNIIATIDEITGMTDEAVSELVYDVPEGRGRHRMESQSNKLRVNSVSWATIVLTSSNSSLYDKLSRLKNAPDGEMRRLIELRIEPSSNISKATSDLIFRKLSNNYGVAGPLYIQHVLRNMEATIERTMALRERIDRDLRMTQSDRFYSVIYAVGMAGGYIGRDLGLFDINVDRVYDRALAALNDIRSDVLAPLSNTAMVAQETLMAYINENVNNVLVINGSKTGSTFNAPIQMPRGPLRMRYEPDTQELWIPAPDLRKFFTERQVDMVAAMKHLQHVGIMKNRLGAEVKRIGAGALGNFNAASLRCYCIDGSVLGVESGTFDDTKPSVT